jgi:hypothetical protein
MARTVLEPLVLVDKVGLTNQAQKLRNVLYDATTALTRYQQAVLDGEKPDRIEVERVCAEAIRDIAMGLLGREIGFYKPGEKPK